MVNKQGNSRTNSNTSGERSADSHRKGKYQVSTNRGKARHKVRYVESGSGEADPNCRLCTPVIKLKD